MRHYIFPKNLVIIWHVLNSVFNEECLLVCRTTAHLSAVIVDYYPLEILMRLIRESQPAIYRPNPCLCEGLRSSCVDSIQDMRVGGTAFIAEMRWTAKILWFQKEARSSLPIISVPKDYLCSDIKIIYVCTVLQPVYIPWNSTGNRVKH